jgi:hypothetical protein
LISGTAAAVLKYATPDMRIVVSWAPGPPSARFLNCIPQSKYGAVAGEIDHE